MRVVRFTSHNRRARLGLVSDDGVIDLSQTEGPGLSSWHAILRRATEQRVSIWKLLLRSCKNCKATYSYSELWKSTSPEKPHRLTPDDPPEVWACGVTYLRSRKAREEESTTKGIYDKVYDADRPEIFFKGTSRCCVGPNESIGIRYDSRWNVPEPELAFVLGSRLEIIGLTAANDVSSRDLEAQNPLYLPQAKIYNGSCALGPSVLVTEDAGTPDLKISLRVVRGKRVAFEGETRTSRMKRSLEELRTYLLRCNDVPPLTVCLTGTGIVPPDDFALGEGDLVEIGIDRIGVLRNPVIKVGHP